MKLAVRIKVRRSLKLRVVIAQFQANAQRVEKELKNFIFFVCLVYKNWKWPNQSLWSYCTINLPRTAEWKSDLSVKKKDSSYLMPMCYLNLAWRYCLANQIWIIDYCTEIFFRLKIHKLYIRLKLTRQANTSCHFQMYVSESIWATLLLLQDDHTFKTGNNHRVAY